jgi:anti-anti-sigma factor
MSDTGFALTGDIDLETAADIGRELLEHVEQSDASPVVIDCSTLGFLDSSGLNMLVFVRNASGKELELRHVPERARRVFELTALDGVFNVA